MTKPAAQYFGWLCRLVTVCICCSLLSCSGVFYYPSKDEVVRPDQLGIRYEDVWIDGEPKLHGWLLPAENPIATVVHLHGNAENISTHLASVYWLPASGVQVLTVDYRGYGKSEGRVDIDGIHEDVGRILEEAHALPSVEPTRLVLFGQSLGGAMALWAAAQPRWQGKFALLVADSPFSSYRKIVKEKLAAFWITYPFQWFLPYLVSDEYSPIQTAKKLTAPPVLLMHGGMDPVVPSHHSAELCRIIGSNCTLWQVEEAGHTQILASPDYRQKLVAKIRAAVADRHQ